VVGTNHKRIPLAQKLHILYVRQVNNEAPEAVG